MESHVPRGGEWERICRELGARLLKRVKRIQGVTERIITDLDCFEQNLAEAQERVVCLAVIK